MFKHLKKTRKFYENILSGNTPSLATSFAGNNNGNSAKNNVLSQKDFDDNEVDEEEYENFKTKMPENLKNINLNDTNNEKMFRNYYNNNPNFEKYLNLLKKEMQNKSTQTSLGEYFKKSALMKLIYEKEGDDKNLDEELGKILSGGEKKKTLSKKNPKRKNPKRKDPKLEKKSSNEDEDEDEDLNVPDDMENEGNFRNLSYLKYCKALYFSCTNQLINREQLKNYYLSDTRNKIFLTYPQILLQRPAGNDEQYCEEAVNFISTKIGQDQINSLSDSERISSKENPPSLEKLDNEILQKFSELFYRALNKNSNNSIFAVRLELPTYQSLFQSEESKNSFLDQVKNYLPEVNVIEMETNPPKGYIAR